MPTCYAWNHVVLAPLFFVPSYLIPMLPAANAMTWSAGTYWRAHRRLGLRLYQVPTTGFVLLTRLLESVERVHLVGFDGFGIGKELHYYKEQKMQLRCRANLLGRFVAGDRSLPAARKRAFVTSLLQGDSQPRLDRAGADPARRCRREPTVFARQGASCDSRATGLPAIPQAFAKTIANSWCVSSLRSGPNPARSRRRACTSRCCTPWRRSEAA